MSTRKIKGLQVMPGGATVAEENYFRLRFLNILFTDQFDQYQRKSVMDYLTQNAPIDLLQDAIMQSFKAKLDDIREGGYAFVTKNNKLIQLVSQYSDFKFPALQAEVDLLAKEVSDEIKEGKDKDILQIVTEMLKDPTKSKAFVNTFDKEVIKILSETFVDLNVQMIKEKVVRFGNAYSLLGVGAGQNMFYAVHNSIQSMEAFSKAFGVKIDAVKEIMDSDIKDAIEKEKIQTHVTKHFVKAVFENDKAYKQNIMDIMKHWMGKDRIERNLAYLALDSIN